MFAYIPDDLLLKGLKLGEFKYKDLEPSVRANKEFIDAALKISVNNLKYVPSSELESLNIDLKKYLADVIASGSFTQISELLKDFGENSKFIDALDKKNVINLLIVSYFEDQLLSVIKMLPKSCLIFKDLNFVKEVFQGLEKDKDITMGCVCFLKLILMGSFRQRRM